MKENHLQKDSVVSQARDCTCGAREGMGLPASLGGRL